MACANTEVSRLVSQPQPPTQPTLPIVMRPNVTYDLRRAASRIDGAARTLSAATSPRDLDRAIKEAELAVDEARRGRAAPEAVRALEARATAIRGEAERKRDEYVADLQRRREAANSAGRAALAQVLAREVTRRCDNLASAAQPTRGLTAADRAAIHLITAADPPAYLELNRALRSGTIEEVASIAPQSHAVSRALTNLEAYRGIVYRQIPDRLPQSAIDRYVVGEVVIENGYTHTTRDPGFRYGDGNVRWVIESHTGRLVEEFSKVSYEHEVIFDRFARFEVLDRYLDLGSDVWTVLMREVGEPL